MSEEQQEQGGVFSQLKAQIVGGVGIVLTGIGTMFLDEVKSFVGIEDEPSAVEAPAQNNQQSVSVTGPAITINVPEQKQSTQTIIREVPVETKKDTVVVEKPKETSTNRLLKYKKDN
jgi:hypothetical protein